jgi:hypothetical protein
VKARVTRSWLPWLILVVAFLIGCTTLYAYSFGDEAGSLWIGLLLSRGQLLYRDIFSHHFPFHDLWAAATIALFGKSILTVRLSVWVFQIASIAIAMWLSRAYLPLAFAALIWSIIRHIYAANMSLYPPFASASLVVVFAITVAVLLRKVDLDWRRSLAVGLFSTIAILSDPLFIYPIAIALIFLLITNSRLGLVALLFTGAGLLLFVVALLLTGTLDDFVNMALRFNSGIKSEYFPGPIRLDMLLKKAVTGLEISDSRWLDFDPLRPISHANVDSWVFTGFLFRLSILVATILLLLQKDYAAAGFLYLFSAATLLNRSQGFRAAGFVLIALVTAWAVVTGEWWKEARRQIRWLRVVAASLLGVMVAWLGIRVAVHSYIQDPGNLSYERHFARHEMRAAEFEELACGQSDVILGYYPGPGYAHWFTEMQPIAGYWLMYPWAAEDALDDVLAALAKQDVKAIVRIREREVIGLDPREYLRPLYQYLDASYVAVAEGVYISPALSALCQE